MGQRIMRVSNELLHKVLILPSDSKVTGLSHQLYFDTGEYALRIESAEFPESEEGHKIPEVSARYETADGVPKFIGWVVEPLPIWIPPAGGADVMPEVQSVQLPAAIPCDTLPVTSVQVLAVKPGDTLVVTVDQSCRISREDAMKMTARFKEYVPEGVEVLIVHGATTLTVLSPDAKPNLNAEPLPAVADTPKFREFI